MKDDLRQRQAQWRRFHDWEADHPGKIESSSALKLIGEWVDFYLSRHTLPPDLPDGRGIRKMHQAFSRLF